MTTLSCADDIAAPTTGTIRVVTATGGVDLDPDGYRIAVDTGAAAPIEANGSILIPGVRPGTRSVHLTGIAPNCTSATTVQSASVVIGDTTETTFTLGCAENVGILFIQPSTYGPDPDTAFQAVVDAGPGVDVGPSGVILERVRAGTHTVLLTGVADNCSASNTGLVVTVGFGQTMGAYHRVTCIARVGSLRVSTTTGGPDADPDGYEIVIDSETVSGVPPTGSAFVANVHEGTRQVGLRGAVGNCVVQGGASRLATITFRVVTQLAFDVLCSPAPRVRVSVNATGVDVDTLYRAHVVGPGFDRGSEVRAGTPVIVVGEGNGNYGVTLEDIAPNCAVAGPSNPRTVAASGGSIVDATFDVTCGVSPQIAFVRNALHGDEIFVGKTTGAPTQLTNNTAEEHDPAYSPDGTRIAFRSSRDGNAEIYVMNADGSGQTRLTTNAMDDLNPEWSPDGNRIAFRSNRDGNDEIYVMNANGSNVVRLTTNPAFDAKPTWSPDGTRIAFMSDRSGRSQIYVMNADGSNVQRLTNSTSEDGLPAWSPDGTRIAFTRDVACDNYYSACHNIMVMNPDGSDVVRFETRSHDSEPAWSPDSQWIVFETYYCTYYDCTDMSISAVRRNGTGRAVVVAGNLHNPAWRP